MMRGKRYHISGRMNPEIYVMAILLKIRNEKKGRKKMNEIKNERVMADLLTSKRTKKILTGKVTAIEAGKDKDGNTVDYCIVFYNDVAKVMISADEMNLYNYEKNTFENESGKDSRRSVLRGLIGAEIDFCVLSMDDDGIAYASRKQGMKLRKALEFDKHNVGEKILARIIGIGRSSVIAEAYGVQTLIPIEEVAWGRIYVLKDFVKVGDKVEAVITEKSDDTISLSIKKAKKDPYEEYVIEKQFYKEKGEYAGKIRSIQEYGVFVELRPGITALCNYPNWSGFNPEKDKEIYIRIKKFEHEKKFIDGTIVREM